MSDRPRRAGRAGPGRSDPHVVGSSPRPGHGFVYVTPRADGLWHAVWHDQGPTLQVTEVEGDLERVLTWARQQGAVAGWLWDPLRGQMEPLQLDAQ